jgi:predicted ferric reductase
MMLSERKSRWQSWVNLILGVILFIAPWYSVTWSHANSSWDAWICGVLIVVVALGAHFDYAPATISWLNIVLGAWVFISPWVLGFASAASVIAWSMWIIGALVFILAIWAEAQYRNRSARATV